MLYAGAGDNRRVFEQHQAISPRFAKCESELTDGRFVVTVPGEALILYPGCLHATLTIQRGVLFGSTLAVAEGVSAAAQSYKHDVDINEIQSFHDVEPLVGSLHQAVKEELDRKWRKVLSYLCSSNLPKFRNNLGKSEIERLIDTIRSILSKKEHPACEHCKVDLQEHFPFNIGGGHGRATKRQKLNCSSSAPRLMPSRPSRRKWS
jgi:hypothetical protein